jgi:MoaA/NifB/PqqE/SkfB family radical SAM enzyme
MRMRWLGGSAGGERAFDRIGAASNGQFRKIFIHSERIASTTLYTDGLARVMLDWEWAALQPQYVCPGSGSMESAKSKDIYQLHSRFFKPRSLSCGAVQIFQDTIVIPGGTIGWLIQIQVDSDQFEIQVEISLFDLMRFEYIYNENIQLSSNNIFFLDEIIIKSLDLKPGPIELSIKISKVNIPISIRHVKVIQYGNSDVDPALEDFVDRSLLFQDLDVRAIFIGTTNICNASCPHCPTNKKITSHLSRGIMEKTTFEKIVQQLKKIDLRDAILFGVFGEPFADPMLEKRIKLLRQEIPGIKIDIATNGALATLERVASIIDDIRNIGIHIEADDPKIYNKLMAPLKYEEVIPNIENIVARFSEKIFITTPLHAANIHNIIDIRQHWEQMGTKVRFNQLQTRGTDKTISRRVSVAPTPAFYDPRLAEIIVIDWDGEVLATCDDFERRMSLGNINESPICDIIKNDRRKDFFLKIQGYRWSQMHSFRRAIIDDYRVIEEFSKVSFKNNTYNISAKEFLTNENCLLSEDGVKVKNINTSRPAVEIPFCDIKEGHYILKIFIKILSSLQEIPVFVKIVDQSNEDLCPSVSFNTIRATKGPILMEFTIEKERDRVVVQIFFAADPGGSVAIERCRLQHLR